MSSEMKNKVHIVGRKNHGKTNLVVELVKELLRRGYAVGTIKHSGHRHELDTPGKDSHLQRLAGASPAAVVTGDLTAVFMPLADSTDVYKKLSPLYDECDIVLIEGDRFGEGLKIEVWRREVGTSPLAMDSADITVVVTDDRLGGVSAQIWPREDVTVIADKVLDLLQMRREQ